MPNDKEFRPRCTQDEYDNLKKYRAIKDHANEMGMDNRDVDSGWLKSKEASLHFKNPNFQAPDFSVDKIDWDKITKGVFDRAAVEKDGCDKIEWVETRRGGVIGAGATIMPYGVSPNKGIFDRLVYTDVHIGMDIPDTAQYGGTWNYDEVMKCLSQMIAFTLDNQKSDILIVDDLGDFMDGMGGKTVRRMHSLPQNMTDQEAFDIGLEFKIRLANELYPQYETIHFHNICNDNHAGAFGYTVNSAFKSVAKTMFKNVTVDNYQKFINHYEILNNTFIISHGKDGKNLKFGFKPHISVGGLGKINNYIDTEYLMKKGVRIEFSKGDSHVELRDKATPNRFEYCNYPAFCPASDWVQTNYVPNDYGFYLFNYSDTNRYRVNPFYFNG